MKNNVYPCKSQFYYIKTGFKGIIIMQVCFWGKNCKIQVHPVFKSPACTNFTIYIIEEHGDTNCIDLLT